MWVLAEAFAASEHQQVFARTRRDGIDDDERDLADFDVSELLEVDRIALIRI